MFNAALRPVVISGANGQRTPWFSPAVNDVFGPRGLGADTNQDWYNRAKREIAQFDGYVERLRRLANRQVREDLWKEYVGDPADSESGSYRRNSVASDVASAESYTPINYMEFSKATDRNRITKLDSINSAFKADMDSAEATYGLLPDPQIIERIIEVQVPGAPAAAPFPIVPAIVVGGVVLVGLALLGAFSGK
jgi:hypothetical protein